MSYLNRVILTTIISAWLVFVLVIILLANILFFKKTEVARNMAVENTVQVTELMKNNFSHIIRLLKLTQQSILGIDFNSKTMHESAKNILASMLNLDKDIYSVWFILNKGVISEDQVSIMEYINLDGKIIESHRLNNVNLEDPTTAPWYFKPLTTGETYFTPKFYCDYDNKPEYTAMISMPVFANGKIIGVCGVNILYNKISDIIEFYKTYNRIIILNRDMTIVNAFDHKLINKNLADFNFKDIDNMRKAIEQEKTYSNKIISPFLNEKVLLNMHPIFFSIKGKP